ncbi:MAG: carboxy-S-adenosyl-L-methionine synthase CmoA [Pseudomonadales bacterium]|jgi:tRNA (cmo5U34)-methyltransferase|nr:carboxy-S-adenosyl-L-methionine synthase CmoA [Pseudomonadales bacterium]
MSARDTIYQHDAPVTSFVFDAKVAAVFTDMIERSVPGYGSIINMISAFAQRYAQRGSRCYDLGCSLGAATLALRHGIIEPEVEIIAIDSSQAMIERCAALLREDTGQVPVHLRRADILDEPIENASLVVLNFTLQFVPLARRQELIERIAQGLRPGGMLVLSEKIHFEDAQLNALFIDLHHRFKEQNGYSKTEISKKRAAIENVLVPETLHAHQARILNAGFASCAVWFQCFNFASLVAVK